MNTKLVNVSDIKKVLKLKTFLGTFVAWIVYRFLALHKVNSHYDQCKEYTGPEFCDKMLASCGIKVDCDSTQLENIPKEGPFITISNHPIGTADGMALVMTIGGVRRDYKVLTNFILSLIPTLKESFFPVNPFTSPGMPNVNTNSFSGLKAALAHVKNGYGLGLFPAGEVSTYQKGDKSNLCKDIEWPANMIKLIKNAGVPVIPVYFSGENSKIFHFVGKIHPFMRTMRLARELFIKKGMTLSVRIGKPILASELAEYQSIEDLNHYMRNRVYALEGNLSDASKNLSENVVPIALPKSKDAILADIVSLENNSRRLFVAGSYSCFLASWDEIPNLMYEIARKREEAFRAIGEGTNLSLDTDDYDKYYKHLILWDNTTNSLAGAYRLGICKEILMNHGGVSGIYSHELFEYSSEFKQVLEQTIELGRSFVCLEYQKENLPLMLLIKGLMHSLMIYRDVRYFIGPVSISNWYPRFYQSLMVYYLSQKHNAGEYKDMVTPRTPFKSDFLRVNPDELLSCKMDSVERFDRFLLRISDNQYRLPTLVKKYIKINSRIICFNVDPAFNYSVDGLILLDLFEIPESELLLMSRDMDRSEQEKILNRFNKTLEN